MFFRAHGGVLLEVVRVESERLSRLQYHCVSLGHCTCSKLLDPAQFETDSLRHLLDVIGLVVFAALHVPLRLHTVADELVDLLQLHFHVLVFFNVEADCHGAFILLHV